jgi:hypothetical protein
MIEIDERALDALLAEDPGGPVVMLNLLRFRPDGGREESVLQPTVPLAAVVA